MKKIIIPWLNTPGYNCICCCPSNEIGLHMSFFEDGYDIVSFWTPDKNYAGWVDTLHGGIQCLLIDELGGWVVCRKLQLTGVTSKLEVKYLKPISTKEGSITIRARINHMMRNVAFIDAEIYDHSGEVCTKGELVYFCASKEKSAAERGFIGCDVEDKEY